MHTPPSTAPCLARMVRFTLPCNSPALSCSAIVGPVARVVFKQERMEGNFRFAHMRLRTFLTELALYRAGAVEEAALEAALAPLLRNQLRLLMWRWLLTACTTGLEYTGALLNYTCIGLVVFTGALQCCPFCHTNVTCLRHKTMNACCRLYHYALLVKEPCCRHLGGNHHLATWYCARRSTRCASSCV